MRGLSDCPIWVAQQFAGLLVYNKHTMVKNAQKRTTINGSDRNLCCSQYCIFDLYKLKFCSMHIQWNLQGVPEGLNVQLWINGGLICWNRSDTWELSKFPTEAAMDISLAFNYENTRLPPVNRQWLVVSAWQILHQMSHLSFKCSWTVRPWSWRHYEPSKRP
jgi:hypothetical protein